MVLTLACALVGPAAADVAPLIDRYCAGCHSPAQKKADLDVARFKDDMALWQTAAQRIEAREMPPAESAQPTTAERDRLLAWFTSAPTHPAAPGRRDGEPVTIRRLNRAEYNNTIRDLFGVDLRPADGFPSDAVGDGFDNAADVLSMPPALVEHYLAAAETIADRVIVVETARRGHRGRANRVLPESHTRLIPRRPSRSRLRQDAQEFLGPFASRAYRRPARPDEVGRLVAFVERASEQGASFELGMQAAVQAVLVSPHFLYRVELDGGDEVGDFALASRLSYFLWSSMPDDELFRLAAQRRLHDDEVLASQVARMLRDPRARALTDNFAMQWLQLRNLQAHRPSRRHFPGFDDELRAAMLTETALFFDAIVREDLSVLTLLDADFTFLNERLARHYGITGVDGPQFRRVALTDRTRGGVLTQASVLTVTSNPNRTSPVKRGRWVLEQILGAPTPPAPAEVPPLPAERRDAIGRSLRERLDEHRDNPACATCHRRMDPLGLGLETFDAVGVWRTREHAREIDASGVLPDGQSFRGPVQLKAVLLGKAHAFRRSLASRMLTYALGRGGGERATVDEIAQRMQRDGDSFSSLVLGVVGSDLFRARGGERAEP